MQYSACNTNELLHQVHLGNADAFNELYNRFWEPFYVFVFKRLKDRDDAKDVVQNVFINLWFKQTAITVSENADGYLFTMVRNEMLRSISNAIRDQQRQEAMEALLTPALEQLLDPLQKEQLLIQIDEQVNLLPARMQQVYRLSHEENMGIREIAVRLDLSEQTVRNHLNAAMKKLRISLKEAFLLTLVVHNFL